VRWHKLKDAVEYIVKQEHDTCWSARAEAVEVVLTNANQVVKSQEDMTEQQEHTTETRADTQHVEDNILSYEFLSLLHFYDHVLWRMNRVQIKTASGPHNELHGSSSRHCIST
jgi:hypothetical protein